MNIVLRLAWRNIWRHRRRTGLTLAAIAFSSALLVFMIALQLGSYDMMIDGSLRFLAGHLQVQAEGYLEKPQMHRTVPDAQGLAKSLRGIGGLTGAAARGMGFVLVSSPKRSYGAQVIGVEPEFEGTVSTIPGLIRRGRYLSGPNAREAVVGSVMARNLKLGLGDELTLLGSGRDGSTAASVLPVVGIFETGNPEIDRYLVEIPLGTFQDAFSMGNSAHSIAAAGRSPDAAVKVIARAREILPRDADLAVLDWEKLQPGLKQAIQADMATAWFMYGALVLIVAFSVLNTFLMSVLERTREFGIMLALGLRPGRIGGLVLLESTLMAAAGVAVGIALGAAVTGWYVVHGFSYPGMEEIARRFNMPDRIFPEISLLSLTLGPAVVFAATLLSAVYPALRIRRLKPVDAMQAV